MEYYVAIPLMILAICAIVVGIVYVAIGCIEWTSGKKCTVAVHKPPLKGEEQVEQEIKRLQELSTLERNHRIASENK